MQKNEIRANPGSQQRLVRIQQARQAVLYDHNPASDKSGPGVESWIEQSWRRCLANGHRPEQPPSFAQLTPASQRQTLEANQPLVQAAKPVLDKLGRAIASTRYFAILTNQHGIVVDVSGVIDRSDRRADLITRIGTDLSERQLATTTISAALGELRTVWLHRGEHFYEANTQYSCAGAPVFGPDGRCAGMLDITGIETAEHPELKHLVSQSARSLENALTLALLASPSRRHGLLLRLNWPGLAPGGDSDGLLCLDADGFVLGANPAARQMLPQLDSPTPASGPLHCGDLFALAFEMLFDAARQQRSQIGGASSAGLSRSLEVPLWSGLRLQVLPQLPSRQGTLAMPVAPLVNNSSRSTGTQPPAAAANTPSTSALKDLETALIRQAVDDARGNVMQAARTLGISRATVYRRLGTNARR